MRTIEISEEQFEWLKKLQEDVYTQDTRSTRDPIYLVERRSEQTIDEDYDTAKGYWFVDEKNGDNIFEMHRKEAIDDIFQELKETLEDKIEDEDKFQDLHEEMDSGVDYHSQDDIKDLLEKVLETEIRVVPFKYIWERQAVCLTEQEAFEYQKKQSHNLGTNRTYAISPGYASHGGHIDNLRSFIKKIDLGMEPIKLVELTKKRMISNMGNKGSLPITQLMKLHGSKDILQVEKIFKEKDNVKISGIINQERKEFYIEQICRESLIELINRQS